MIINNTTQKHSYQCEITMAQRREGEISNGPANSEAFSIADRQFLATDLARMTDLAILGQSLRLKSVILTASSFGRLFQTARSRPELQRLNQIGVGLQGAVFEQVGKPLALKKESPGNEKLPSNLYHEYKIHCDVSAAFEHYQSINREVRVPIPFELSLGSKTALSGMKSYQKSSQGLSHARRPCDDGMDSSITENGAECLDLSFLRSRTL
ncbi:unnamed protein product [Penicillium egyptiacum]|uniref:Uncharacterized protein n=1 Tax=Penicillium egyptiacum TaxID=1303716 RepID=A0A9W4P6T1_9EURO|nr:unnamed protein product [Penicillium egyptiacum]